MGQVARNSHKTLGSRVNTNQVLIDEDFGRYLSASKDGVASPSPFDEAVAEQPLSL
jgi:hypothetical protein